MWPVYNKFKHIYLIQKMWQSIEDTMNILFFRNYIFTLDFVGETAVKRNNSSSLSYKQSFLPFKNGYCICWHQDNDLVLGPRITLMMASFFCLALLYVCDAPNIICVHVIQARSMPPPPSHTHTFSSRQTIFLKHFKK